MNHNHQKKACVINDFTGFGRCSLAVSIPIISTMKVQCCAVPTSILSNHTGFDSFYMKDTTQEMPHYLEEWKKLDLHFNGISSGFLGSKEQVDIVIQFIETFKNTDTIVSIDPVMGDNGKLYSSYTQDMTQKMKELIPYADIITPNLTEACILTNTPYHDGKWTLRELRKLSKQLSDLGPSKIVITGIPQGEFVANMCYETNKEPKIIRSHRIGTSRSGTGDIFASIILADAINNVDFLTSVRKATRFIKKCILKSIEMDIPLTDGVCFEECLGSLK